MCMSTIFVPDENPTSSPCFYEVFMWALWLLSVLYASTECWLWLEVLCGSKALSSFFISSFQKYFVMFSHITSFYFLLFSSNLGSGKICFFKSMKCPLINYCRKRCFHVILAILDFCSTDFISTIIMTCCKRDSVPTLRALVFLFYCLSWSLLDSTCLAWSEESLSLISLCPDTEICLPKWGILFHPYSCFVKCVF